MREGALTRMICPMAPDDGVEPHAPHAMREARLEAVAALALDIGLLVTLAALDGAMGWNILRLPSWAWLLATVPAALLILELLFEPFAQLTPRKSRNVALALLSLLLLADVIAVSALIAALIGTSTDDLSAGDLLAHGSVVWLTNIITCGLLFWMLDEGGPQLRNERGRHAPDFRFPQDVDGPHSWMPRLGDYLYVALTNAVAVSPTDTMPLTLRAKGLMAAESLISYAVIVLVVSRAVGVLGSSA
jgi:uncharacterized membrane protein